MRKEPGSGKQTENGDRDWRARKTSARVLSGPFLGRDCNVAANARSITRTRAFEPTDRLALIDGNIADRATAERIAEMATSRFGSIDGLVNNAGIYLSKPFTESTADDLPKPRRRRSTRSPHYDEHSSRGRYL